LVAQILAVSGGIVFVIAIYKAFQFHSDKSQEHEKNNLKFQRIFEEIDELHKNVEKAFANLDSHKESCNSFEKEVNIYEDILINRNATITSDMINVILEDQSLAGERGNSRAIAASICGGVATFAGIFTLGVGLIVGGGLCAAGLGISSLIHYDLYSSLGKKVKFINGQLSSRFIILEKNEKKCKNLQKWTKL